MIYGGAEGDLAQLVYRTADNLRQLISLVDTHPRLAASAREAVELVAQAAGGGAHLMIWLNINCEDKVRFMFRIRRIYDNLRRVDRQAMTQVQDIMRSSFPTWQKRTWRPCHGCCAIP